MGTEPVADRGAADQDAQAEEHAKVYSRLGRRRSADRRRDGRCVQLFHQPARARHEIARARAEAVRILSAILAWTGRLRIEDVPPARGPRPLRSRGQARAPRST